MKAWQDPTGVIRDVAQGDPVKNYHHDVAAFYSTDVPDGIVNGATLVAGVWTNPPPPPAPIPPTAAEIAVSNSAKDTEQAKSVRASRNSKLADCDWTQVADSPVDKAAWATYRQALRDVTVQSGFPWTITWPDAP